MGRTGLVMLGLLGACSFELTGGTADGGLTGDAPTEDSDDGGEVVACPSSYPGGYRLVTATLTWLAAENQCEADRPGQTHLVVIESEAERVAVAELAQALPGDAWVGIVRDPGGGAPWPWRYVTGGAATFAPFEGSEPNNMSGDQYIVAIRKSSRFLYDYSVTNVLHSICECDGRPPINADFDPGT